MLLDTIVDFCDKKYSTLSDKCGNGNCTHPTGSCSGSCYNCLHQIHENFYDLQKQKTDQKLVYDCPKMMYQYVCQFSYLYASEIEHALIEKKDYLRDYPYYHILSLGCGAGVDLMAFEHFHNKEALNKNISYFGIDSNENWDIIQRKIEKYCDANNIKRKFLCEDAIKYLKSNAVNNANIIVISYMISYLYNNGQIKTIDEFIDFLVENAVLKKKKDQKMLIIINDLNTYKKGRNYFSYISKAIEKKKVKVLNCTYKYFDTGDLFPGQMIGTPYEEPACIYNIPLDIQQKYHARTSGQKTIQLIIEVI